MPLTGRHAQRTVAGCRCGSCTCSSGVRWRPARRGKTYVELAWTMANALTDEASRRAREIAPDLEVRAETVPGDPAGRLLELARDAELVVPGHRGRGGFAGLRLGSVSERVAKHAPCRRTSSVGAKKTTMSMRLRLAGRGLSAGKRARLHRILHQHGLGDGTALSADPRQIPGRVSVRGQTPCWRRSTRNTG